MKYPCLSALCCFASVACSTVGSFDSARLNSHQAAIVADSMTSDLKRYPHATIAPAGTPLFDAFSDNLESKGWELQRSQRYEVFGGNWQSEYLRVQSSKTSRTGVIVSMKTPYFDVNQGFETDTAGGIYPVTNPTLFLKRHEN